MEKVRFSGEENRSREIVVILVSLSVASHLNGPWHTICVQEGAGLYHRQLLGGELLRCHPAPLRRALQQGYFHARHLLHPDPGPRARSGDSSWAIEGMVVTGKLRRAPDQSCSHFTVANVHINNGVCQAEVRVHRTPVAHPGPVHEARRCHPYWGFQQGR